MLSEQCSDRKNKSDTKHQITLSLGEFAKYPTKSRGWDWSPDGKIC